MKSQSLVNLEMLPFALLLVVFVGVGAAGSYDAFSRASFLSMAQRANGVVESFRCPQRSRDCLASISFTVHGSRAVFEANASPSHWFHTGSKVEIAYKENRRGAVDARLAESMFRPQNVIPIILGIGGTAMTGIGFWVYLSVAARHARRVRVLEADNAPQETP